MFIMPLNVGGFKVQRLSTKKSKRHSVLEAAHVATNRILMDKVANGYLLVVHP
jgi:hypothetical protein